jgi:hypothetical protein
MREGRPRRGPGPAVAGRAPHKLTEEVSTRGATIRVDGHDLLELAQKPAALFRRKIPRLGQIVAPLEGVDIPPYMAAALLAQSLEPGFQSEYVCRAQNFFLVTGRAEL